MYLYVYVCARMAEWGGCCFNKCDCSCIFDLLKFNSNGIWIYNTPAVPLHCS